MLYCINPGHGGKDPGAIGPKGLKEAAANLLIALKVDQYLTRLGHKTVLTRKDNNTTMSLDNIVQVANKSGAGAFLSIHCNAAANRDVRGKELWYPNNIDNSIREYEAGVSLSYLIDQYTDVTTNANDRGSKFKTEERQEFYVIRKTTMPAALIECGFISNIEDENLLSQSWYQEKLALGIVMGLNIFSQIP